MAKVYGTDNIAPRAHAGFRIGRDFKLLAMVGALCAVTLVAITQMNDGLNRSSTFSVLEEQLADDLDTKFLLAESDGEGGREFLQRMQRLWFVSSARNLSDIQQEATRLATKLQTAGFPPQVQNAINTQVNPCEDFYEFAV